MQKETETQISLTHRRKDELVKVDCEMELNESLEVMKIRIFDIEEHEDAQANLLRH